MARTVTVSAADVSLFHVAAAQLGNPLQWWQIAQLNGMTDPMLTGITTLTLPAPNATLSDGFPPQS